METTTFHTLAKLVAGSLGPDWGINIERNPHYEQCWMDPIVFRRDNSGQSFRLRPEKDRINVFGDWPKTADGREVWPDERPSISVAQSRTPDAIAKEIKRRFLPDYERVYAEQLKRAQSSDDYATLTEQSAKRLENFGRRSAHGSDRHSVTIYALNNHAYSVSAQGQSVRFEAFSCPIDKAVQVLELLRKADHDENS